MSLTPVLFKSQLCCSFQRKDLSLFNKKHQMTVYIPKLSEPLT